MDLKSWPPSYHMLQYHPPCCDPSPMWHKPMASSSQPYNYKHFTNKPYSSLTPLNPTRRMQMRILMTMKIIAGASASGYPRTLSTHQLMVVSIPEWDG
jgi:hypothetical protein